MCEASCMLLVIDINIQLGGVVKFLLIIAVQAVPGVRRVPFLKRDIGWKTT